MNAFLYTIIFIIGTLFGSFYTLAIYRIPNKIDIVKTHSFCPNCNHKLGFFELIPILSYIFLGGKCKQCKQKIRPRYFMIELLSGLTFVLIAFALKFDVYNIEKGTIIRFGFIILYLSAIFIIAGIDKEYKRIEKSVLYYSFCVSAAYIIYLCIMESSSIYRYGMYLCTLMVLLLIDTVKLKKEAKSSYIINNIMLCMVMCINTGEIVTILSIIITFLSIMMDKFIFYIKNSLNKFKKENKQDEFESIAFLTGIANVILFIGSIML